MSKPKLEYDNLLQRFDDLVAKGLVNYSQPRAVSIEDDGFHFDFHITTALLKKPQAESKLDHSTTTIPTFGPGSDIANPDPLFLVATINATHLLIINKFCVFRPMLLLLTVDSYRRQSEALDEEDFKATAETLTALEPQKFYAIFNCGVMAGMSRRHKHVQVLPRVGGMFPDDKSFDASKVPFRYFLRYLDEGVLGSGDGADALLRIYRELLEEAGGALGDEKGACPHNVVLVKEWVMVIPRRSDNYKGVTANAAGMVGSVWLMREEQLEGWKEAGLKEVLGHLGVPRVSAVEGGEAGVQEEVVAENGIVE